MIRAVKIFSMRICACQNEKRSVVKLDHDLTILEAENDPSISAVREQATSYCY